MKRVIKFRGLRTDGNGWAFGDLLQPHNGNQSTYISLKNGAVIEVWPESVGQFANLLDKNGEEIYEGDTVYYDNKNYGYIKFEDGGFVVVGHDEWLSDFVLNGITVSGNIHEQ